MQNALALAMSSLISMPWEDFILGVLVCGCIAILAADMLLHSDDEDS